MAQYSFCPLCLSERKHYEAREQRLRELARKWGKVASQLRTGNPDFSDGLSVSREECAAELRAILNEVIQD